jgi:hypothetical protein
LPVSEITLVTEPGRYLGHPGGGSAAIDIPDRVRDRPCDSVPDEGHRACQVWAHHGAALGDFAVVEAHMKEAANRGRALPRCPYARRSRQWDRCYRRLRVSG